MTHNSQIGRYVHCADIRAAHPAGLCVSCSLRGHFYEMAGDHPAAMSHYRAAASRTSSIPERSYVLMKAGRLDTDNR